MTELLIIKPSSLGDIVQALQVATSLKAQRQDLRISWVVREIFAPLVRVCEAVDHVYVFERKAGTKGFLKLMGEVRRTKFDYIFDMQGLLRTGLMASRARAAHKVGRTDSREGAGLFYSQKVPLPPDGRRSHALDILLQFCPVLGAKPELRGTLRFREAENLALKFTEGRAGAKPFLMFPDSRRPEKRWDGFKQLTEMIVRENRGHKVIGLGHHQRQRADAPGRRAARARPRDLRADRPPAFRALSADRADKFCHPGPRGGFEITAGKRRLCALPAHKGAGGERIAKKAVLLARLALGWNGLSPSRWIGNFSLSVLLSGAKQRLGDKPFHLSRQF